MLGVAGVREVAAGGTHGGEECQHILDTADAQPQGCADQQRKVEAEVGIPEVDPHRVVGLGEVAVGHADDEGT